MFLSDPALRAIAAATNDVWPEHVWRHDTATGDWSADRAARLHATTLGFNANAHLLDTALRRVRDEADTALQSLTQPQTLPHPHHIGTILLTAVSLLERHRVLRATLVEAYTAWREHQPTRSATDERHLLARPHLPDSGVLTLHRQPGHPDTWLVTPDTVAAARFAAPYAGRIIGSIAVIETLDGWQPTAFTHPQHQDTVPHLVHRLPATGDEAAACRTLLRWWRLRHSADWQNRTPEQLTDHELAALSA